MDTERLRGIFADFLASHNLNNALRLDSCCTIDQDVALKYERIDRYRIIFMDWNECKKLLEFCAKHDLTMWFGADKLCIGYNYKGNMRLSAYSVPLRSGITGSQEDRNVSVSPEISAGPFLGDRIPAEVR
ncbi:MAG: hypothetical protein OIN66_09340 [Candidatus Methanoperedens sp.]|nr:hypothetical protein [Candidatus Methanoperedens sp.]